MFAQSIDVESNNKRDEMKDFVDVFKLVVSKFSTKDATAVQARSVKTKHDDMQRTLDAARSFYDMCGIKHDNFKEIAAAKDVIEKAEFNSILLGAQLLLSRPSIRSAKGGRDERDKMRSLYASRVEHNDAVKKFLGPSIMTNIMEIFNCSEGEAAPSKRTRRRK